MNRSKGKKAAKIICIFIAVILVAVLIQGGIFLYAIKYRIAEIDSSVSADGRYELFFQSVGEPDWPFGASHARLVLKQNQAVIDRLDFDVANDGKNLSPDNWTVAWKEDSAAAIISGEEQPDALYVLYFSEGKERETAE